MFRLLRRQPRLAPIDPELWRATRDIAPWWRDLDPTREARLQHLVERFNATKTISCVGGLSLDDVQRTMLAGLCCLPLLEYGPNGLGTWSQLVVYPGAFRARRQHEDRDGVRHDWDEDLIGEAWTDGPVVLSWADVEADREDPRAGVCVAIHEIAHVLDSLDGLLDGTPLLPRDWQREWARDFQSAYNAFVQQVDAGVRTVIDPYAAESPEEFFAVTSESHFSTPDHLRAEMPRVALHLQRLYGPAPFARPNPHG